MTEKTYKIYYSANGITPIKITENDDGTVDLTIIENTSVAVTENDGTVDLTIPTE